MFTFEKCSKATKKKYKPDCKPRHEAEILSLFSLCCYKSSRIKKPSSHPGKERKAQEKVFWEKMVRGNCCAHHSLFSSLHYYGAWAFPWQPFLNAGLWMVEQRVQDAFLWLWSRVKEETLEKEIHKSCSLHMSFWFAFCQSAKQEPAFFMTETEISRICCHLLNAEIN